jgi:hypothetical protein
MTGFAIGIAAACIAATVWWVASRRYQSPWIRAAERFGLKRVGATVVGQIEGHHVAVHVPRTSGPAAPEEVASLHCRLPLPLDLGLSIRPLSGGQTGHDHGDELVPSTDGDFDTSFASFADEKDRAAPLLKNKEMLAALFGLADVEEGFAVTDDGVQVELKGRSMAPERLAEAVSAALAVVRQMERVRHDLPVAGSLAEHRREWAAVAGALGLELSTAPLAVAGVLDGIRVAARTRRRSHGSYGLVVVASFDEPLGLGLTVTPRPGRRPPRSDEGKSRRKRRQRFSKLFDENKHRVRVRFRRTFDVRADEVWAADHLLNQATQEALLTLHGQYDVLTLDDEALRVRLVDVPRLREPLENALHGVAAAGRIIGHGIGGAAHDPQQGPYR